MRNHLLSVVLLVCPAPALGGLVFFDDFDGNALLPHWGLPDERDWEYNVSNSMLNVTGLFFPSLPPSNIAGMSAPFGTPQTDYVADVWMGWMPAIRHTGWSSESTEGRGVVVQSLRGSSTATSRWLVRRR